MASRADGGRGNWSKPVTTTPNPYNGQELAKVMADPAWQTYRNSTGTRGTAQNLAAWGSGSGYNTYAGQTPNVPANPFRPSFSGGGGGGRGGGGGGGGGGPSGLNQAQLDWAASLLGRGPQQQTFTNYTAPQYQAFTPQAFDASSYDKMRGRVAEAGAGDLATAAAATGNMDAYLRNNFNNAYASMPQQTQVGDDQAAMSRFLASQGVGQEALAGAAQGQAAANQGFQNLWRTMGAIEDSGQRNRLNANQLSGQDAQNMIRARMFGGNAAVDQQQSAAQQAYNQWVQNMAYQDWTTQQQLAQQTALANWQGQQQTSNQNVQTGNEWNQNTVQALISLLGSAAPGLVPNYGG